MFLLPTYLLGFCFRKTLIVCVEKQLIEQHLNPLLQKGEFLLKYHVQSRTCILRFRVLTRFVKMPVQNSTSKISVCPDLATNLLQILILTTYVNDCVKRGNLHIRHVLEDGLLEYN